MLQTLTRFTLFFAVAWLISPPFSGDAVARQAPGLGQISGVASIPGKGTLAGVKVQLRDLKTKQIVATATTNADGQFVLVVFTAGDYIVEIVDEKGAIMGTSPLIRLVPGAMIVSAVAISPTAGGVAGGIAGGAGSPASEAAGDAAASPTLAGGTGTGGLGAAAGSIAANIFGSSIGAVSSANVGGATAGTVPSRGTASPSQ